MWYYLFVQWFFLRLCKLNLNWIKLMSWYWIQQSNLCQFSLTSYLYFFDSMYVSMSVFTNQLSVYTFDSMSRSISVFTYQLSIHLWQYVCEHCNITSTCCSMHIQHSPSSPAGSKEFSSTLVSENENKNKTITIMHTWQYTISAPQSKNAVSTNIKHYLVHTSI